jgi:hypothetical protein
MKYFITNNGYIVDENDNIVTMEDGNESFEEYYKFLQEGGTVEQTNLSTENEEIEYKIDVETQTYLKRISDGANIISKFSAELRVGKLTGSITEEKHKVIDKSLKPVRYEILAGQWISAKDELILLGSEIIGQNLYNRIYKEIQTYINNNY